MTEQTDTAAASLKDKFAQLRTALETELVERTEVVDTMLLALLSQTHHFQLGVPGVAKSYSIRKMLSHIDGLGGNDLFEILLTRFSSMEEFWGAFDLRALEEGRYRRIEDLSAWQARFWFVDEVFKASSSLLNSFLWGLNERTGRNDGQIKDLPLWSMFCASNELPESEELNALYDRIHFRMHVKPIQEPSAFVKMLTRRKEEMLAVENVRILSFDEVKQAFDEVQKIEIPSDVLEALHTVRVELRGEGIEPTDRRFVESLRIIRAAAWLGDRDVADIEDVRPLTHVMWSATEEIPKVQRILLDLANPLDKKALEILEIVEKMQGELETLLKDDMDKQLKNKRGVELHNRVERAQKDLAQLQDSVSKSGRRSPKTEEARRKLLTLTRVLLKDVFGIDVDEGNLGI